MKLSINPKYKGIIYIILSAFMFGLMGVFVKLAGDIPSVQKSFFRNFVALIFALIILLRDKSAFKIHKGDMKYLILRAAFGTAGILCNFYAVDHLVLSDASILNKMSPFFAILCSYFILKEKFTPFQGIVVLIAFIGSLFVIKPSLINADLLPSLIGLFSGFSAGVAYTFVRVLGNRGVKGPFIVFFFSTFSCLVTLPYLIFNFTSMTLKQAIFLLLCGLSAAGGQFTITAAYVYAPAREISIYDYTQIIFTTLFSFFIFNQIPDALSFLGYALIVAMAIINFLYNNKKQEDQRQETR